MKLRFSLLLCLLAHGWGVYGQSPKPKLVVGLVVDQMRYDYLYRYEKKYGTGGFKRLLNEGYNVSNCHYNYVPTYTAPGHTSIYTGCTPATHGIIGNNWFDHTTKTNVYCTNDTIYKTVGASGREGQMAPTRMLTSTIGDELRIASLKKSKVFGVALKDRSSILPAGHGANGAFWFDGTSGSWISSTYYYKNGDADLPQWIKNTNEKRQELFLHYLDKKWETLGDIATYTESIEDNNPYESTFTGETSPVFPHDLPAIKAASKSYGIMKATPFGNTITKDFAKLMIENEKLGMSGNTDMICISFSSTDYVGHQFGPTSKEVEDTYIRLDKDLEDLLVFLDKKIGKGNYLLFLTADHGAVEVPEYLKEFRIPGGNVDPDALLKELDTLLEQTLGPEKNNERYLLSYENQQLFFNTTLLEQKNIALDKAKKTITDFLMSQPYVANVYDEKQMREEHYTTGIAMLLQNGYNAKRSGHLLVNYQPGYTEDDKKGTTHGSPYSYDTHVPLIFMGTGIKKGKSVSYTTITQIAPTVCSLLNIPFTNGTTSTVIEFR